ncbi:hypothetical protein MC52_016815 [Klebsiella michiganensis]|nr:hypothetical protein C2U44_22595 [Klebsiella oxytoca]MBZ7269343.1 hypothetical protein [Klebsiella michiganensis]PNO44096.1 hypothetical protein MC52_016815 [Klebsiella michiganensis]POT84633.1 hypothetical protein C3417_25285 [Klebsiella oxytoca]POV47974.1 hypothetical protein C3409_27080 [Klebsiella oxytoca]
MRKRRRKSFSPTRIPSASGSFCRAAGKHQRPFSPVALRLPGLRVSSRLRGGSPGKVFTPRPGISGLGA